MSPPTMPDATSPTMPDADTNNFEKNVAEEQQPQESPFPAMSPPDFDCEKMSEADQEQQIALKQQGAEALEDGNLELALEKFTAAIVLGTDSALLYSRRAQVLLGLNRFDAVVNDCDAALALNPDSAKAYKIRARAHLKSEKFVEAYMDFSTGQKIDFDDDTDDICKEISEKVKQLQAEAAQQRLKNEKENAAKKLQENKRAYEEAMRAREPEMREQRMAAEKEKERQKDEVRNRNRAKQAEEAKRDAEEEEELNASGGEEEVHASDGEEEVKA